MRTKVIIVYYKVLSQPAFAWIDRRKWYIPSCTISVSIQWESFISSPPPMSFLYNSFSTLFHIVVMFSASNWHTYFLASSNLFSASKNVALCSSTSYLTPDWLSGFHKHQEHCQSSHCTQDVTDCATRPLWVSLHCHHCCWHNQLRNLTSQAVLLQASAVKNITDNTSSILEQSPICHGCSLPNWLLSVMALEYMDDSQIWRL
jgi:hypothetical protein